MSDSSHIYIAIDLKSFYASVECVERECDPLTTNLVVADESRTEKTICLAVSPSLKKYGLSGRARLFEVIQKVNAANNIRKLKAPNHVFSGSSDDSTELQKNPSLKIDYIIAPPRMARYMEYSTKIYNIYLKYIAPEDIHIYSIDEVFIDVTHYLSTYNMTARTLAMTMIQDILDTTGITATAGIGTNMYLCKIAMDIVAKHIEPDKNSVRIAELDEILKSKTRIKTIIVKELKEIAEKYGQPRKSIIIYEDIVSYTEEKDDVPDYPVNLFFTKEGYFKKITPQSLRMSSNHKLKDGDEIAQTCEFSNNGELLFFTDKCQVYKAKAADFADTKASTLGDYVPAKLGMDEGENAVYMVATKDYKGMLLFAFENGKLAKVPLEAYQTKTNRKKLTGAYSDKSPLAGMVFFTEDKEFLLKASSGRMLLIHSGAINLKTTRSTQGVAVMKLKKGHRLFEISEYVEGTFAKPQRYRTKTLPTLGAMPANEDSTDEQLTLI